MQHQIHARQMTDSELIRTLVDDSADANLVNASIVELGKRSAYLHVSRIGNDGN